MTGVVWLVVFNTKEGLSVQGASNWKKDKVAEV
jgi:hypothetical protein